MSSAPRRSGIPSVSSPLPNDMRLWVDSITTILRAYDAQNPNAQGVDAAATLRDLLATTGVTVRLVPGQTVRDKPTLNIVVPAESVVGLAEAIAESESGMSSHAAMTVVDSTSINLTLTGQQVQADLIPSGVSHPALADLNTEEYSHITGTEKERLAGIETGADVTDAVNVAAAVNGVTEKTTPVDADTFAGTDSEATGALKRFSWANIKATLKAYFDTLYALAGHTHSYIPNAEKGAANGVATLDAGGYVPVTQIPPVAITDTYPVASEAEMLALVCQKGDVAVRSDLQRNYILRIEPASVLANWQELATPTDTVLSVNGKTGVVVLNTADIGAVHTSRTISTTAPLTGGGDLSANRTLGISAATTGAAGSMSATDKTKLDGIESGATADMTASEILTAIKTVDGAGSGLDADTLDGYNSNAFELAGACVPFTVGSDTIDANNYLANITVGCAAASTNIPVAVRGILTVARESNPNNLTQLYQTLENTPRLFLRCRLAAAWKAWVNVTTLLTATDAEAKAKASTTVALTPSNLAALVFESAEQTVSTSAITLAINHGLGSQPVRVSMHLRCKTAELGYAVGDEIEWASNWGEATGWGVYYQNVWSSATQVGLTRMASAWPTMNKTTGAFAGNLTPANWRIVLRASLI